MVARHLPYVVGITPTGSPSDVNEVAPRARYASTELTHQDSAWKVAINFSVATSSHRSQLPVRKI
jgi:hypothetical protein